MSGLRDLSPPPDKRRLRDAIDVARFEPGDVLRESEEPGARAGEALVHALQRFMAIRRRRQPEALAGAVGGQRPAPGRPQPAGA